MKGRPGNIRFLVVDDHSHVRSAMHRLISILPEGEVVAEAANGAEALQLIPRCRPHVVLMDIVMPVMDGLQATEHMKRQYPDLHVILYTGHDSERFQHRAQAVGADALYAKEQLTLTELQQLIHRWFPTNRSTSQEGGVP